MRVEWNNYPNIGHLIEDVYSLDERTIDQIVPANKPNGNYKIYRYDSVNSVVNVIYVGRVADRDSDEGLKVRLKEHIGEWQGLLFFNFIIQNTPVQAYNQECIDYHDFRPEYNIYHPDKLSNNEAKCPICEE